MTSYERTSWRDGRISLRHRAWGMNCPGIDLDFLFVEYHHAIPVAIIEYKHHRAAPVDLDHANYRAMAELARRSSLPFMIVRYWVGGETRLDDPWAFRVTPVNAQARDFYMVERDMTELEYVMSLCDMRKAAFDQRLVAGLDDRLHPHQIDAEAA